MGGRYIHAAGSLTVCIYHYGYKKLISDMKQVELTAFSRIKLFNTSTFNKILCVIMNYVYVCRK